MSATSEYSGGCHCGAIGFRYRTAISPADWSVRACQCAFCRAHDALSTSDPAGSLDFFAAQPTELQRYRFALGTADFLLCRRCGVYIGAILAAEEGVVGIINTHALKPQPAGLAAPAEATYDGEQTGGRVERRIARWTPASDISAN